MKFDGKPRPPMHAQRAPLSICSIAELLNEADAGLTALTGLLRASRGSVPAEGIATLLQPYADAVNRASAEMNDRA